ncbi:MAG: saccharopine dehydrogenase NADP-binding domain-containing protein [Burkholderiales bacterium]|nr:saccharopine dehydrogenase NADP-binding domain-containing protein [Burkholderiales bacterium]
MSKKPVVVYGASGYTGQLACEFLRHFQIPFIAAGRDRKRLEEAMRKVPGIETADYEIAVVEHDVAALTRLLTGAKVVCNIVGPFLLYGETVVQAALAAGCHYLDTTGEQAFILAMRDKYGAEYGGRGLLLAPCTAYQNAVMEIACRACADHEEIDTIEAVTIPAVTPTVGSAHTLVQMVRAKEQFLENGQLTAWPPVYSTEVVAPFTNRTVLGIPGAGLAPPVWFASHPRIRNLRALCAFGNRGLAEQILGIYKYYHNEIAKLPEEEQIKALAKIADGVQSGMPPRENPLTARNWDTATGSGTMGRVRYTIYSHSGYQQTGLLQAFAASCLLRQRVAPAGFQSPSEAFGYRNVLGTLERFGYARMAKEA